jgi:hypothetical protein
VDAALQYRPARPAANLPVGTHHWVRQGGRSTTLDCRYHWRGHYNRFPSPTSALIICIRLRHTRPYLSHARAAIAAITVIDREYVSLCFVYSITAATAEQDWVHGWSGRPLSEMLTARQHCTGFMFPTVVSLSIHH